MDLPRDIEAAAHVIRVLVGNAQADQEQHARGQLLYSRAEIVSNAIASGLFAENDFALIDVAGRDLHVFESMRESLEGVPERNGGAIPWPTDPAEVKELLAAMNRTADIRNKRLQLAAEKAGVSPFLLSIDARPDAGLALRLGARFVVYESDRELFWGDLSDEERIRPADCAAPAIWSCQSLPTLAARLQNAKAPAGSRWLYLFKRGEAKRFPKAFRTEGLQPLPPAAGLAWCSPASVLWSKRSTDRGSEGYHEITAVQGRDTTVPILGDVPARLLTR